MLQADRREFVRTLLAGAAGLTLTWRRAGAQGRAPVPITATRITDRIVAFSGNGGNEAVVIGPDGLVMIDGGLAPRAADLANAIAEISPRMVQVLFNTHYHFDHVGSNEYWATRKVRIIAHENVKMRLATTFENPAMGRTMDALPVVALPTETFTAGGRVEFGAEIIQYTHTPVAHTDGDAFVFFANSNVIHTGDLYWVGRYPVVDYSVGGSLARMAAVLEQMDKVGDARTRIISGHGNPNGTKPEMREIRNAWVEINRRLEAFAKQGRTVEEVIAAAPTKEFDGQFGNPMGFLRQAYGGVLARHNAR